MKRLDQPSWRVVLSASIFNAVLTTAVSAGLIALISQAGYEERFDSIGIGPGLSTHASRHVHPLQFLMSALWLSPLVALSAGSFGFFAGLIGALLMRLRVRRRIIARRFTVEATVLGGLLALVFPFFDAYLTAIDGRVEPYYFGPYIFATPVGLICGCIGALVFRKYYCDGQ